MEKKYTKEGYLISEYLSVRDASRYVEVSEDAISNCCRGVSGTSGGYDWRYL